MIMWGTKVAQQKRHYCVENNTSAINTTVKFVVLVWEWDVLGYFVNIYLKWLSSDSPRRKVQCGYERYKLSGEQMNLKNGT